MSTESFIYVWAYRVAPGSGVEFQQLYGPEGDWTRLFRQVPGYLGTDLYRDRDDGDRYLTIDRWESEEAFRAFRVRSAEEFERLDSAGDHLTLEETSLGEFGPVQFG